MVKFGNQPDEKMVAKDFQGIFIGMLPKGLPIFSRDFWRRLSGLPLACRRRRVSHPINVHRNFLEQVNSKPSKTRPKQKFQPKTRVIKGLLKKNNMDIFRCNPLGRPQSSCGWADRRRSGKRLFLFWEKSMDREEQKMMNAFWTWKSRILLLENSRLFYPGEITPWDWRIRSCFTNLQDYMLMMTICRCIDTGACLNPVTAGVIHSFLWRDPRL